MNESQRDETSRPPGRASKAQPPGVCIPWQEKRRELPVIPGDAQLARRVWEDIDEFAYMYVWHCLVSF